jgi:CheY-like chemotaxis protein
LVAIVVDDEEPVRAMLAMLLEDAGHQARQAIHGGHALALLAEERPDLVLADVMMPVLSGTELCRRLKAAAGTRGIPVILMSAGSPRAAEGAGAEAFLAKPFDLERLEALVQRWALPA